MARPTKLTPEMQAEICKTLGAGVDIETACLREGVGRSTYYDWKKRADEGEEPFATFVVECERVMATVETAVTVTILKAAKVNWQAGAWWLRFKKTGGKQQVELSGPGGRAIGVLSEAAADEIRHRILYGDLKPAELPSGEEKA
jgi:hypothetical protein